MFRFVQLEYGFALGPADGRYLTRAAADAEPEAVVVLRTLGAPQRRMLRGRKPASMEPGAIEPEPVPTARATLVDASERFESASDAEAWLAAVRKDEDALVGVVDAAVRDLNRVLRAHRVAALDPFAREVSAGAALVVRVGYGSGEEVADGRFAEACELPRPTSGEVTRGAARRRSALQPQERLAAILGGRDRVMAGEELLLRARGDIAAGEFRSAALQARVALEALIAELGREARDVNELRDVREALVGAANAALEADLDEGQRAGVTDAVEAMERALRRRAHAG